MIRIAIDGPGGAGKSSVAKAVAKKLGIIYVDTGALYRTIGVFVLSKGVSPSSEEDVTPLLSNINIELKFTEKGQVIVLNGNEVGEEIRTPEASMAASAVSALGSVRAFLLDTQRKIAETNSVIMDGRDIGTVILPGAEVKIFLTASPEARAERRFKELCAKGIETTYDQVYKEMVERDKNDSTRALAPCKPADDAILLDNSTLTFDGTVEKVISIIENEKKNEIDKPNFLYRLLRAIVKVLYRPFRWYKVIGAENIPKDGGALLLCNHIGISDILILGMAFPRQLHFLAKKEAFNIPVVGGIMRKFGAIRLDRGGKDVGALKEAIRTLENGKIVVLFPQGHRYPAVNPATTSIKFGAGIIAYRSGAKVIPVCIKTKGVKYRIFRKIELIIGKPIENAELGFKDGGTSEYRAATELVFNRICELGGYEK
jgi:cytidylate kinase